VIDRLNSLKSPRFADRRETPWNDDCARSVCAHVRACVRVRVYALARSCVCVCACMRARVRDFDTCISVKELRPVLASESFALRFRVRALTGARTHSTRARTHSHARTTRARAHVCAQAPAPCTLSHTYARRHAHHHSAAGALSHAHTVGDWLYTGEGRSPQAKTTYRVCACVRESAGVYKQRPSSFSYQAVPRQHRTSRAKGRSRRLVTMEDLVNSSTARYELTRSSVAPLQVCA
jgi:hypothetical protein